MECQYMIAIADCIGGLMVQALGKAQPRLLPRHMGHALWRQCKDMQRERRLLLR